MFLADDPAQRTQAYGEILGMSTVPVRNKRAFRFAISVSGKRKRKQSTAKIENTNF